MGMKTPDLEAFGESDYNDACAKRGIAKVFKDLKANTSGGSGSVNQVKRMLPLMILMCQAMQVEGLELAGPLLAMADEEFPRPRCLHPGSRNLLCDYFPGGFQWFSSWCCGGSVAGQGV